MSKLASLALLMLLLAVWSASLGRLFAQDGPAGGPGAPRWSPSRDQVGDQTLEFSDGTAPLLERLPPPDEPLMIEELPPSQQRPDRRLGGGATATGNRAPFTAQLFWIPPQNLKGQPGTLAVNGEEIKLAFPVHIAEDGIWLGLADAQRLEISTSAVERPRQATGRRSQFSCSGFPRKI